MRNIIAVCLCITMIILLPLQLPLQLQPSAAGAEMPAGAGLAIGEPAADGEGGDIYRIPVYIDGAPAGAVCGLMLSARLSDGWRITRAETQGQGREHLTVTVRRTQNDVYIMLDGIPAEPYTQSDEPLLWLVADGSDGARTACTVTLTAHSLLYYMNTPGCICTCPLDGCRETVSFGNAQAPADTQAPTVTETAPETETHQTDPPDTQTEQGTAAASEATADVDDDHATEAEAQLLPAYVLVGCREAVTADGSAVEFLFRADGGAGEGCPAVWLTDCPGGYRVTLHRTDGDGYTGWVFYGLPTQGRVTFTAADRDGRLYRAFYTDGVFDGWSAG